MNTIHPIAARLRVGESAHMTFHEYRSADFMRFVLQNGCGHAPARLPKGIRRGCPGTCYETCAKFAINPRNRATAFSYAEGVAMRPSSGLLVAHAWLVRDGEAFDITWKDFSGGENLDCQYFGVEFSARVVGKIISARGYYGLLDPVDDLVMGELSAAMEAA